MANTNTQMRLKRKPLTLGTFPNIPSLMYIENQPFDKSLLPKLTWMQIYPLRDQSVSKYVYP